MSSKLSDACGEFKSPKKILRFSLSAKDKTIHYFCFSQLLTVPVYFYLKLKCPHVSHCRAVCRNSRLIFYQPSLFLFDAFRCGSQGGLSNFIGFIIDPGRESSCTFWISEYLRTKRLVNSNTPAVQLVNMKYRDLGVYKLSGHIY